MISTLALGSTRRSPRSRWFQTGLAAGLVVPLALLLLASVAGDDSTSTPTVAGPDSQEVAAQRDALTAFESALAPLTERGASAVVYGMRPGVNDIYAQRFDDETLATMAEGWLDTMRAIRADVVAVDAPPFLADAADLYRQAFDAYVATAESLLAAARSTGDERQQHITNAAEHGTRADDLYEAAKAEMVQHRDRLGRGSE